MIKIFPASKKDVSAVASLEQELYPQPWSQKDFEEILAQEAFWFWVAKKENAIVGYLVCQVVEEKEAELHNIAVAREYQRQGIGKTLLQKLIGDLKQKNVSEIFLMVRASNLPAQKLYESFGFKKISVRQRYYHNPEEEAWIYRLRSAATP